MRIAVSGASGLIGSALVPGLEAAGNDVVRLVRRDPRDAKELGWDPATGAIDADGLAWEAAAGPARAAGVRVVNFRQGIVLSRDGGRARAPADSVQARRRRSCRQRPAGCSRRARLPAGVSASTLAPKAVPDRLRGLGLRFATPVGRAATDSGDEPMRPSRPAGPNAPEEEQVIAEPQLENFDRETV